MIGIMNAPDAVFAELCKADPAQSVFVLPPDGNLRQRVCAADRVELMEFARDLFRRIDMFTVLREVSKLLVICGSVHLHCELKKTHQNVF